MASDTVLVPPPGNPESGAAGGATRIATIHPVKSPTSPAGMVTAPGTSGPGIRPHRPARSGWPVLVAFAGIVLMALNLRTAVTAVPPLLDTISGDLGFGAAVTGLLGALPALAFATAGLLSVRLLRRFSGETIAVGLLLVEAGGQALRPWAGSAAGFLAVSAITLLGMGVGNVVLSALVKAWFPERVAVVTATYAIAIAIGTSIPALVAVPIAHHLGWHRSLALWSLTALVVTPFWLAGTRHPRVLPPPPPLESRRRGNDGAHPHRIAVHRSPITWGLVLLFGMNALNLYAMFTFLPVRLTDAGLSDGAAGVQLALFAGVGILPSLLIPVAVGRYGRPVLLTAVCVAFFAAGYLGLLLRPTEGTFVWTSLAGLGGGGFPLVLTLFGLRSATPASAGALSGFTQGIGYLFAASGPLLFGWLHDVTHGWTAAFAFLGVTLVVMLVGGWMVSGERTVDEDLRERAGGSLLRG
jgi:CP family cyanate transporter-like MFS transporter